MKTRILEGKNVYLDGELEGPLQLEEGQRSDVFVILESCSGPLYVVEPTEGELAETRINEAGEKEDHLLSLEGRFQMADTLNANGRIYPNSIWENVFGDKDLMKGIDNGEMLGESDHPKDGETRLSRVCGKVSKVWRNPENNKEIMGRFSVFNNENGRNLKAIHEGGGRLGVSSRGKGSVVRVEGNDVVQEDFGLQTWDVVHGPSTPGAYPEEVTESVNEAKEPEMVIERKEDNTPETNEAVDLDAKKAEADWNASWIGKKHGDNKKLKDAFMLGWTGKGKSPSQAPLKIAHSLGAEYKKGTRKENMERPEGYEEVLEITNLFDVEPTKEVHEALRAVRTEYRDTFDVEGPLTKKEVQALNEAAKQLVIRGEKLDEVCPTIRAWVGNTMLESVSETVEARTEGELRRKIAEIVEAAEGKVVVNIDRSEVVYEECAKRFSALLEAQTLKAEKAVRSNAGTQASVSELSAKLAGAKKLIESFAVRCKRLQNSNKALLAENEAACRILDEMPKEVHSEGVKGAVTALMATNPNAKDLGEALISSGTVTEAITTTKKSVSGSLPKIEREPTYDSNVKEALRANDKKTQQLTEAQTNKNKRGFRSDREMNLTRAVAKKLGK